MWRPTQPRTPTFSPIASPIHFNVALSNLLDCLHVLPFG
jgi:hypothetical protein